MKKIVSVILFGLCLLFTPILVNGQTTDTPNEAFARGKVLTIDNEGVRTEDDGSFDGYQELQVEILSGVDAGQTVRVDYVLPGPSFARQKVNVGDTVVLDKTFGADDAAYYYIIDKFRLPTIGIFAMLFFLVAALVGRAKGIGSVIGLLVSLAILLLYIVPAIAGGQSPVIVCAIGSILIAFVSILLAHGFYKRTYVALGATLLVLVVAFLLAALAVYFAALSGGGTEEATFLQFNFLPNLDLRGLFLGGIVIGALGVLDDVTTAQVASVEEIHNANEKLDFKELYRRGISIGHEHIASLVNTLALAYVGASFPVFMLFAMPDNPPLWVLLNGEQIIEEIIRALVGGTVLVLAVPISTFFAAYFFQKLKTQDS